MLLPLLMLLLLLAAGTDTDLEPDLEMALISSIKFAPDAIAGLELKPWKSLGNLHEQRRPVEGPR